MGFGSTGGFAVDSFPMVPGLGQAVETVWRWYTRARGMLGALSRQPRAERPHIIPISSIHHQYIPLGRLVQIYISVHPHHVFRSISPSHRPNPPGTSQGAWIQPHASPLARCHHPRTPARTRPPCPRGLPPPLRANWSTPLLRDAQHPVADWSIPLPRCMILFLPPPPRLLAPLAAARAPPTKATQPTGSPSSPLAGAPLEGEPLWHHRATRGLPGVGYPPGARPSTTPARAGVVHNRPRDTPCRRRAPALTLRACQRPAVPAAHPPPVRERRAPCPVRLAQSCLSTYPPTPFGSKMVNVV